MSFVLFSIRCCIQIQILIKFSFHPQTPKRTPSKRKTFVERAQAESEQLLKSMGIAIEEGKAGRRTRSGGARSSPVVHVESPAKKAKTATPKGKGRGKKLLDVIADEKVC